jgi:hypothetical protein
MLSLTGNEVLVKNPYCGILIVRPNVTYSEMRGTIQPVFTRRANSYSDYAQSCYASTVNEGGCGAFIRARIPTTVDRNASCPFKEDICLSKYGNIKIDTGMMDSAKDLGMNAPKYKQVLLRRILHCAPLVTEGYTKPFRFSTQNTTIPYTRYYYGVNYWNSRAQTPDNHTYMQPHYGAARLKYENSTNPPGQYGLR